MTEATKALIASAVCRHPSDAPPRLDLSTKVLYGVGEIAGSVRMTLYSLFVLFFYTSVMGLSGSLVGLAAGIGLIWDAIIDPPIGHASDRARLPLGRRHTFMFVGAASIWATFWAFFSPPLGLGVGALFAWFMGTNLLARVASSLFAVPHQALNAELSRDARDRTVLAGIRGFCGLVGGLVAASAPFVLFFPNIRPGEDPRLNHDAYPAMGLAFGLVMSLAALVATLATLPWRHQPDGADGVGGAAEDGRQDRHNLLAAAATAWQNRAFRTLILSFSLVSLGAVVSTTLSVYFFTYYAGITDGQVLSTLQVAFFGGSLAGSLLWLRIAPGRDKRLLYLGATATLALVMASAFMLVGAGRPFGTGDARPILFLQAVAGLAFSMFAVVPPAMLADVVDDDAAGNGRRRAGLFFGLTSFSQQLVTGLSVLIAGVLVDRFAGLVPGQAIQSAATVERIGALFSVLPAGLLLVAALLILRYPLEGRRVAIGQAGLALPSG